MEKELSTQLTDERECDREAIHLFASVQPHGCALGFSAADHRVQVVSENIGEFVRYEGKEVLGAKLDHLFSKDFVESVDEAVEAFPWKVKGRHLNVRPQLDGIAYDAFIFESEGLFFIELEPRQRSNGRDQDIENEQQLRDFVMRAKGARTIAELSKLVCSTIREITGLDRVMMYRFLMPFWHGEVIGEDRVTKAASYMGHRFPASDIPRPARDLYLRNFVRLIPNVNAEAVGLKPRLNPKTKKPVDLSDSRLRSVSKVHLEYLKNMGVGASFSVAVTHEENLWGLIACHHLEPIFISQSKRTSCETIAHIFSIQAPLIEAAVERNDRLEFEVKLKRILESLRLSSDPLDDFFRQHRTVTETFRATGIALLSEGLNDFAGMTPLKADIEDLAIWLRELMQKENKRSIAIDNLAERDPRWEKIKDHASGVLAVLIPEVSDFILLIFRPEFVRTITWGGDPRKQLEKRNFQGNINPRASFEAWEEVVKNHSEAWARYEVDGISFVRDFVFDGLVKKERMIRDLTRR